MFVRDVAIGHRRAVFGGHVADGVVAVAQVVGTCSYCTIGRTTCTVIVNSFFNLLRYKHGNLHGKCRQLLTLL
jgi:hypothetical protein